MKHLKHNLNTKEGGEKCIDSYIGKALDVEIVSVPDKSKSINKSYSYDDLMHALAYGHVYGKQGQSHDATIKDYKECMNFIN